MRPAVTRGVGPIHRFGVGRKSFQRDQGAEDFVLHKMAVQVLRGHE
jgi:hypothetical protein